MTQLLAELWIKYHYQSSDILTQGRQTFCPFKEQTVTAAQAYESAFNFLNENTGRDCFSLLDWIQAIMECFDKEELLVRKTVVTTEIKVLNKQTKQRDIRKSHGEHGQRSRLTTNKRTLPITHSTFPSKIAQLRERWTNAI